VDVANTDIGIDDEFVVGRMVSPRFFRDKRLPLPAHRGPFKTALEMVTAETKLLGQRTRHLSASPAADYYSEVGMLPDRDFFLQISLSRRSEYEDSAIDLYYYSYIN
jgi:hypothetical protein